MNEIICDAITERKRLQFTYKNETRVVEPHLLGQNQAEHLALSAWFVRGYSESGNENGWREYLVDEMTNAVALDETFTAPRAGYEPSGGTIFHAVVCAL